MSKFTTEEFIEKAKKIHNNKYDYSLVDYVGYNEKIKIICPEHGEFEQTPRKHLLGRECPSCARENAIKKRTKTIEQFIEEANQVHNNKYDYSKANYINARTKIEIICPKHGIFEQTPSSHLSGQGCPTCGIEKRVSWVTTEDFIKRAKEVHGDKYDYSLVNYKNNNTKVKIICPIHGEFLQEPKSHLNGFGCSACSGTKKLTTEDFIKRAKEVHNNKYDYSLVDYKNIDTKIKIICPVHGVFEQIPYTHLKGIGCSACVGLKKLTTEEFIKKSRAVHGDKYDYSLVEYKNAKTKVKIICPVHGVFLQEPRHHLSNISCPVCCSSHGEEFVAKTLESNNYVLNETYFREYRFKDCKDKKTLPFDFYIPSKNLLIEYHGKQHYEPNKGFKDTRETFLLRKHHDWLKRKFAKDNKIKLLVIPYWEKENLSLLNELNFEN